MSPIDHPTRPGWIRIETDEIVVDLPRNGTEVDDPELWLSTAVLGRALHDLHVPRHRPSALAFLRHDFWRTLWWGHLSLHVPRRLVESVINDQAAHRRRPQERIRYHLVRDE